MNPIDIIDNNKDKELITQISQMLEKFDTATTPIQIENFILNDVEFPTDYGKFRQCQLEMYSRLSQIQSIYFDIKEAQIEIRKIDRDLAKTSDSLDKELLLLNKEKKEIQIEGLKRQVRKILKEAKIFFTFCQEHNFYGLSPEEMVALERENWAKKTLNRPTIFEERYGSSYMTKMLGEENYSKYLQLRKQKVGLLPRELLEINETEKRNKKLPY